MKNLYLAALAAAGFICAGITASAASYVLPSETVSVGDVLVASVKTYAAYYEDDSVGSFTYSDKDYSEYKSYAIDNGLLGNYEFTDLTATATKLDAAVILSRALPQSCYEKINSVYNITDIQSDNKYYGEALTMCRAGIMVADENKCFEPDAAISVGELAQSVNRLVFSDKRTKLEDEEIRGEMQAYMLNFTDNMNGPKEGIESGWEIDNRAGGFRNSLSGNGTLTDCMYDESSRLIRHFNSITDDKIDARFRMRLSGEYKGDRVEFCDSDGNPVYRIVFEKDGVHIQNPDGSLTKIGELQDTATPYAFRVIVDLKNGMSTTTINNKYCGEHPLLGDEIKTFGYTTSKEGRSIVSVLDSYMYSNYALYENLNQYTEIPYGFTSKGSVEINSGEFHLNPASSLSKRFDPIAGNVAFCLNTFVPEGASGIVYSLMSDGKDIVMFTVQDGNLYANGALVRSELPDELWHKLRIEADTESSKAVIKLNAKVLTTVNFLDDAEHFDEIRINNSGFDTIKADDLSVYNLVDYDVPEPVIPEGADDYIIGMNICSLWINGEHYGWGCVTPYEDITPVLGYYDEGLPVSADWENKFMAEHGIDFQAFCWYANQTNAPMKSTRLGSQLDEGYLHSKYSDDVKFCLLWEAANASRPANSDAFRNYFVPYWIENYFTDPRYMTIDNKLVFSIFGADQLISVFGTGLKDEFDYMRNEVKKLGFDGMIITASHTGKNSLAAYGFDAWQAYNWGTSGYDLNVNINSNKNRAANKDVYVIPTVSVGFNSIPWHGIRYPLMTPADFKEAHEWIRDKYLPDYAHDDSVTWNDNLVWLSTWNEYGEGTYIMPADNLHGFGYLDALREVYTDGGEHTDHVPTEEQKRTFNHLYPQDRRILRAYGNYVSASDSASTRVIDLTVSGEFNKYFTKGNLQSYQSTSSDGTTLKTLPSGKSNDAILHFNGAVCSGYAADDISHIEVVASGIPEGMVMQTYFTTNLSPNLSEGNSVRSLPSEGTHEQTFILNLSEHSGFTGNITYMRLDPLQNNDVTFTIKSITIVPNKTIDMYINDVPVDFAINPEYDATYDTWLVPFEPGKSYINFLLYVYHEWDYDTKVLKLYRDDKCVEFTSGSDIAKVDGVDYKLSAPVYQVDNIPMLPIEDIADIFGFGCEFKDDAYYYTTPEKYIFDATHKDFDGTWNFDLYGSIAGWQADNVGIDYGDGTIIIISNDNDPRFRTPTDGNLGIDTSKYSKIEIRCRWERYSTASDSLGFYFTTDSSTSESQSKFVGVSIAQKSDEFVTLTLDMSSNSYWTGTLKNLRFDMFNSLGFCEVDYIKLTN